MLTLPIKLELELELLCACVIRVRIQLHYNGISSFLHALYDLYRISDRLVLTEVRNRRVGKYFNVRIYLIELFLNFEFWIWIIHFEFTYKMPQENNCKQQWTLWIQIMHRYIQEIRKSIFFSKIILHRYTCFIYKAQFCP